MVGGGVGGAPEDPVRAERGRLEGKPQDSPCFFQPFVVEHRDAEFNSCFDRKELIVGLLY